MRETSLRFVLIRSQQKAGFHTTHTPQLFYWTPGRRYLIQSGKGGKVILFALCNLKCDNARPVLKFLFVAIIFGQIEGVWRGWVRGGEGFNSSWLPPQGVAAILKGFSLLHLELGFQDGCNNGNSKLGRIKVIWVKIIQFKLISPSLVLIHPKNFKLNPNVRASKTGWPIKIKVHNSRE